MSIRTSYSESSNGLPPAAIIDPENFSELDKQEDLDVSPISNEDSQKLKPYAACNALIEAGRFDEALIAAEALAEMGEKDVALSNLCEALAKADRFDEIPPIAEIISNKHRRCLVFRKLCKDLTIAGHFEKARQIAWEYIDDMYSQSYALADICKAKAKAQIFR